MRRFPLLLAAVAALASTAHAAGPFSPAAGVAGSNAIHMNSALITNWATGYLNYLPGSVTGPNDVVAPEWQTPQKALGHAVGDSFDIVSLGNKGSITLTFGGSIFNGAGADFSVFENGFSSTFLELARVEVSSNGTDFVRFQAYSLTPGAVNGSGAVDPTNLGGPVIPGTNNTSFYEGLAGKYQQGYGTPFDLSALIGVAGVEKVDLNHVRYVRLVDIMGNGSETDDFPGTPHPIYDIFPTFGSVGFDLDAVGVMHFAAAPVPEPGQFALLGAGFALLIGVARRRARRHTSA